jgi:hypothetical protein
MPLIALWSFVLFGKQNKNYIEHLVINAYATSQSLAFFIVSMPFFKLAQHFHFDGALVEAGDVIYVAITLWVYLTFFNQYKKLNILLRTLLSLSLSVACFLLIVIGIAIFLYHFNILK